MKDEIDAGLITRYCLLKHPEPWTPRPIEQRHLRSWTLRVQALKDNRQQEQNRLEPHVVSGMADVAAQMKEHLLCWTQRSRSWKKRSTITSTCIPELKHDAQLIASIPGVAMTTVARVLGRLCDTRRFDSAEAFAAFLGVTPKQRTSGSSVKGRTMMSKTATHHLGPHCSSQAWQPTVIIPTCVSFRSSASYRLAKKGIHWCSDE